MHRFITVLITFFICQQAHGEYGMMMFDSPPNWRYADLSKYPKSVKVVVVGKGKNAFPPQMNLNIEPYQGSLEEYLKIVKAINTAQHTEWKNLGAFRTEAGIGNLSQIDVMTEWGEVRMMHVILIKDHIVYILNASALKQEFSNYYKDFFSSLQSLRYSTDPYDVITASSQRQLLERTQNALKTQWLQHVTNNKKNSNTNIYLFDNKDFQEVHWLPFKQFLSKQFPETDSTWQEEVCAKIKTELFAIVKNSSDLLF